MFISVVVCEHTVDIGGCPNDTPTGASTPRRLQTTLIAARECSVIDETDLETGYADVEPVLGLIDSRTSPGKTHREATRGGCPRTSKAT